MPFRLLTVIFCLSLSPIADGQEIDYPTLLDSFYWEKRYDDMVKIASDQLMQDPDLYVEVSMNYHLANAHYKLSEFAKTWSIVVENHERSKALHLEDSSHVMIIIDQAQKVGDYSFFTEESTIGGAALEYGLNILEDHRSHDLWRKVKLLHKAGAVARLTNDLKKAEAYLQKGIDLLPQLAEGKRSRITPVFQSEIAEVYNDNNQPQRAIEIYLEMLQVATKEENLVRLSIYNNNIGLAYERLRDYGKAKYHFEEGLKAKLKVWGAISPKLNTGYTNLARIHTKMGEHQIARDYYVQLTEMAAVLYEKHSIKNSDNFYMTGLSYFYEEKYDSAQIYFQKTWDNRALHVDPTDLKLTDAQQMVGLCLVRQNQIEAGASILEQAALARDKSNIPQDYELMNTYCYLHEAYLNAGQDQKATKALQLAFAAIDYDIANPYTFEQLEIPTYLVLPLTYWISSNPPTHHLSIDPINIAESLITYLRYSYHDRDSKKVLAEDLEPLYEAMVDHLYQRYIVDHDKAILDQILKVVERSNNTFLYEEISTDESQLSSKCQSLLATRKQLLREIDSLQLRVGALPSAERQSSKIHEQLLTQLTEKKAALYATVKAIEIEDAEYYEKIYSFPFATLSSVQKHLDDETTVASYYFGRDHLYLLKILNDDADIQIVGDKERLTQQTTELHKLISQRADMRQITDAGQDLYRLLIAQTGISESPHLIIIPDEVMALLPFDVVQYTMGLEVLQSQHISYQFSASLLTQPRRGYKKRKNSMLAMAPVFADMPSQLSSAYVARGGTLQLEPLLESASEVDQISALYSTASYVGPTATRNVFLDEAPQASIIHIATHAVLNTDSPSRSYLAFASEDGYSKVYADEISSMELGADLVTLSACNTGSGRLQSGEGVSSLGRAFTYAGCPNLLMSLWSVNDRSTTALLASYYKELSAGSNQAESLHLAKLNYLASSPQVLRHPYFWSGFVYYGADVSPYQNGRWHRWLVGGLIMCGLILLFVRRRTASIA